MEIILSERCKSLTGNLGSGFGYFIVKRKGRFYSVRSKHNVPPDGHWRFILACAELAKIGLHISDVKVGWTELYSALYEAHNFVASEEVRRNYSKKGKAVYDARDIINIKIIFGL